MNQVQLCPDKQSPELSVPCSTTPNVTPTPGFDSPDFLPFTGTAWFWLLLGIAVGAVLVGLFLLWRSRRKPSASGLLIQKMIAEVDATKEVLAAELGIDVPQLNALLAMEARRRRAEVQGG